MGEPIMEVPTQTTDAAGVATAKPTISAEEGETESVGTTTTVTSSSFCSIPPLDEITTTTMAESTKNDDDDVDQASDISSVSSVGSDHDQEEEEEDEEEEETEEAQEKHKLAPAVAAPPAVNQERNAQSYRSIFPTYWDTNGGTPPPFRRSFTTVADVRKRMNEQQQDNKKLPAGPPTVSSSRTQRRSIFHKDCRVSSRSLPSFEEEQQLHQQLSRLSRNKAQSESCLRTPVTLKSCLRAASTSSLRSVSFKEDVDVILFEKPMERHASPGWMDWFT